MVSVSGVAPDAVRLDQHRQGRLADLGVQGRDETLFGQQRRVDAAGQVPQVVERGGEPVLEHGRDLPDRGGVLGGVFQQAELDLQGDELLLGAVVQVPLDLPPFGVLASTSRRREAAAPRWWPAGRR